MVTHLKPKILKSLFTHTGIKFLGNSISVEIFKNFFKFPCIIRYEREREREKEKMIQRKEERKRKENKIKL